MAESIIEVGREPLEVYNEQVIVDGVMAKKEGVTEQLKSGLVAIRIRSGMACAAFVLAFATAPFKAIRLSELASLLFPFFFFFKNTSVFIAVFLLLVK